MPLPNKTLLLVINVPTKILIGHYQENQTHSSTYLNLNPALKAEATIETPCLQKAKNHMAEDLTLLTQVVIMPWHPPLMYVINTGSLHT